MKLGSLFDGSGGFPLAGSLCGIEPVWAAEVEPYPIAVTRSRFPNMKHLGDISKVNGAEIEPVDIITFGSPCQDLSVAGKRAGLKHEANGDEETTRSGLFMEAVRIIKEMREATNGRYPTFALWENVPGAFSSNKGEDFRIVCEELVKIVEPRAVMPTVPSTGWPYADSYCGDGWSLAYRVFDAQYWGVPKRRRRIHLVLDLGGERAREVLFEREGVRGYFAEGRTPWQAVAGDAENCSGATDREGIGDVIPINTMIATRHKQLGRGTGFGVGEVGDTQFTISAGHEHAVAYTHLFQPMSLREENWAECDVKNALRAGESKSSHVVLQSVPNILLDDQGGQQINVRTDDKCQTLRAEAHGNVPAVVEQHLFENHSQDSRYKGPLDVCPMLPAQLGTGGNNTPFVVEVALPIHDQATRFSGKRGDKSDGKGNGLGVGETGDPMNTLTSGDRHAVCYAETYQKVTGPLMANSHPGSYTGQDAYTDMLVVGKEKPIAIDRAFFNQGQNAQYDPQYLEDGTNPTLVARGPNAVCVRYIVRRLTHTECARLQGFPDAWGHPDKKDELTDEEYSFWLEVRNTHAAINGKAVKDYTKEQMLAWYNKLHTDSAEYKMWGNGIALPPALFCMQGMVAALRGRQAGQMEGQAPEEG